MEEQQQTKEDEITLSKTNKAALSVLLAPTIIGTLVMMFWSKDKYVNFYSIQILILGIIIVFLQWALNITVILRGVSGLLFILGFGLWLLLIYKAWLGSEFSIPLIGDLAKRLMMRK